MAEKVEVIALVAESSLHKLSTGRLAVQANLYRYLPSNRYDVTHVPLMTVAQHQRIVAGLEADKRRLDYLDSQLEAYGFENEHLGNRWLIEGAYNSVRDAIDDEMRGPGDAFLTQTAEGVKGG